MNDEPSFEADERIKKVATLLIAAGWLTGMAHNKEGLAVEWTQLGVERAKQLRMILKEIGGIITDDNLAAIHVIVDKFLPGQTGV